jgi:hypothetical protein
MTIPTQSVSPNLPLPQNYYSQDYLDTLTKVLRLYFATNDNINNTLINQTATSQALIWMNPNL